METTKHLPAIRMEPASIALFAAETRSALTVAEAKSLTALPVPEAKAALMAKISSLGQTATRPECDQCLADLALVVPSTSQEEEDYERKLDLYFGIFRMEGVTHDMLRLACARYAAAPTKGKAKFFPDPGALIELVADEAKTRKRTLFQLRRGLDVLEGKLLPAPGDHQAPTAEDLAKRREQLGALTRKLSVNPAQGSQEGRGRPVGAQRQSDPEALKAALRRRMGTEI